MQLQSLRGQCHSFLHRLVHLAGMGVVVAQGQKHGKGVLQKSTRVAHHGMAQSA